MNLFLDPLPDAVTVEGRRYQVRTDFKTWVRFDALMQDETISIGERWARAFLLCFAKGLPENAALAARALLSFYRGQADEKEKEKRQSGEKAPRVLSFTHDAPYIYAAVLSQYGVDLVCENPHWYLFCAMVKGLDRSHKICDIMHWRSVNPAAIKDKKMRAFYREMKRRFMLPLKDACAKDEHDIAECLSKIM